MGHKMGLLQTFALLLRNIVATFQNYPTSWEPVTMKKGIKVCVILATNQNFDQQSPITPDHMLPK